MKRRRRLRATVSKLHLCVVAVTTLSGAAQGRPLTVNTQEAVLDTLILIREGRPDTLGLVRPSGDPVQASFRDLTAVVVRLSDDSPEDATGGAALFGFDLAIGFEDGTATGGRERGFEPLLEGGFARFGYLAADGAEVITLTYDFSGELFADQSGLSVDQIEDLALRLVLGNDYRVEVFLVYGDEVATELVTTARAAGNVLDLSNLVAIDIKIVDSDRASVVEPRSWAGIKSN